MLRGRIVKFDTPNIVAIGAAVGANLLLPYAAVAQDAGATAAIDGTIPKALPQSRPAVQVTAPTEAVSAPAINTGRFTLGAVHIEGATAFTPAALSPYFEPYLATEVDEKILAAIAARSPTIIVAPAISCPTRRSRPNPLTPASSGSSWSRGGSARSRSRAAARASRRSRRSPGRSSKAVRCAPRRSNGPSDGF